MHRSTTGQHSVTLGLRLCLPLTPRRVPVNGADKTAQDPVTDRAFDLVTDRHRRELAADARSATWFDEQMKDDQGQPLTDAQLLDRVAAIGALVVVREAVESKDFATWRRELRRNARARGLRISVLQADGFLVVHNPDHVVTEPQRQAAFAAMNASLTALPVPVPETVDRSRRRTLRIVGREDHLPLRSPPPA